MSINTTDFAIYLNVAEFGEMATETAEAEAVANHECSICEVDTCSEQRSVTLRFYLIDQQIV